MRWLMNQPTGTDTQSTQKIEMAVGATPSAGPHDPQQREEAPEVTRLHSMMCSSCCATSMTAGSVMNQPISDREEQIPQQDQCAREHQVRHQRRARDGA